MNKANFFNPLGTGTGNYQPLSTAQGALPNTPLTSSSSSYGKLTQAGDPRSLQFSAKLTF